jgi:hypothetical protein
MRKASPIVFLAATALSLALGYALKHPCVAQPWDGRQYRRLCYTDVLAIYYARGLIGDRTFPPAEVEYPAGTVLYLGVANLASESDAGFMQANAVGLAIAGFVTTAALVPMAKDRRRVLLFALGPPVVLYAFHNWDLLAVALGVVGLLAFSRRSDGWSGFLLGLGAAVKLFPALILPALLLARAREKNARGVLFLLLGFAAGYEIPNLMMLILEPEGWRVFWTFQADRGPNFETWWFMAFNEHLGGVPAAGTINIVSALMLAAFATGFVVLDARRERSRPYVLGFTLVVSFLLVTKVYSPQYSLWLLPFFAILAIPWYGYVAFVVSDAAVLVSISAYFAAISLGTGDPDFRLLLTEIATWARYAVLLWMLWLAWRSREEVVVTAPQPALGAKPAPAVGT